MKSDVYQLITDRIIALLEAGVVPWQKPWNSVSGPPRNFISQKAYRGINLFLLHAAGYQCPFWLTFNQIESLAGKVKKGEKSFPIVFWKIFETEEKGEVHKIPFLRYYRVFNVLQCEGIPWTKAGAPVAPFEPIERCEGLVRGMPKRPAIDQGRGRAGYSPFLDRIEMPDAASFASRQAYYNTLFHELTHATGHSSRLGRKEIVEVHQFGSDPYSREELVAEMGAAFLSAEAGISPATLSQSAAYIQNWLRRLKDDRKLVVQAAAQAQKAADYILGTKFDEPEGSIEYTPKEFKVVALRECLPPSAMHLCDRPLAVAEYWKSHVTTATWYNPECECLVVFLLNAARRIRGHHVVSIGIMDAILVHPREVFRAAIIGGAASIILAHNHPSGDPTPSAADIRTTQELVRIGKLVRIEVLDHVIIGNPRHSSLREMGFLEGTTQ